jgi:hypothetical protein
MRRRELSMGLFAAATAPSLPAKRSQAQECTAACYPQTSAESTAAAAWAALKPRRGYPTLITSFPPGVVCSDCVIGRSNPAAVAGYYIDGMGTGSFILRNTTFVGTPPAAIQNIRATQIASVGPPAAVVPITSSITFDAGGPDRFVITPASNANFTINAPSSPMIGKRITVVIRNTAGALGVVTWNAAFKLAEWTQPLSGASRSIEFSFDGTNWIEASRTPLDVPL